MINIRYLLFSLFSIVLVFLFIYFTVIKTGLEYGYKIYLSYQKVAGTQNAIKVKPWAKIKYDRVVSGLDLPTFITNAGDDSNRLFVVEKAGRVKIVKDGKIIEDQFLDIRDRVRSAELERGLLSLVFHPNYSNNGKFFVYYTDLKGSATISEFKVSNDPNKVLVDSERILLKIEELDIAHNGGQLQFGPDGYLYIGTGDDGYPGDRWDNAQNKNVLLGKILRIDVDSGKPYSIPKSNPFTNTSQARDEIWAYGLRNPWRFSFDSKTGDMYIADVGEFKWEYIHFQPRESEGGENYGWNYLEGFHEYRGPNYSERFLEYKVPENIDWQEITFPVVEYGHGDEGCSITGGYVYRGVDYPNIDGTYLFSDFCSGKIWGLKKVKNSKWIWTEFLDTLFNVSTFGLDENGEIYFADFGKGGIYKIISPRN